MTTLLLSRFSLSSLFSKIFLLAVGVSVALVIILFAFIDISNQRFAQTQIESELRVGERVMLEALANEKAQLSQAASVLASDFGLRDAIATNDTKTILSALNNHAARIKAPIAAITGLDGTVFASNLPDSQPGQPLPFLHLIENARKGSATGAWSVINGHATLLVAAPVKGPLLMGWVILGFPISPEKVKQLSTLTDMDVAFVSSRPAQNLSDDSTAHLPISHSMDLSIDASSLRPDNYAGLEQSLLQKLSPDLNGLPVFDKLIEFNDENYQISTTILNPDESNDEARVSMILFKSMDQALAPYHKLRLRLLLIAIIGLLIAMVGSRWLARTITAPIGGLVNAMRGISSGDYSQKISVHSNDEVEQLALGFNAMTNAVAEREEKILYQASHDSLTGLANYRRMGELGDQKLEELRQQNKNAVIFKIDIDRFRYINESLGYEVGNQTLIAVAQRLTGWLRDTDFLARESGNQFALLLPSLDQSKIEAMFRRLNEAFEQPVAVCGETIDIRFSVGCAYFPEHGQNVAELLQKAEIAMFMAKHSNLGMATYDSNMEANSRDKLTLLGELRQAVLVDNELQIYLQPKVHLGTDQITQAEALVRWIHPQRGFIPPSEFIPFAEQTGYITQVTRWMLERVVPLLTDWKKRHGWTLCISVNVSMRDLQDVHFPAYVERLLKEHNCPPKALCLEVTESGLMDDPDVALATLNALDRLGLTLSIDDFGTGYSSLAYLRKMPVRELKIDRSFVQGSELSADARALLKSTIDLGHNLGMVTVAEGVETEAEMQLMMSLGCDYVQGYLVSKPMASKAFEDWYGTHRSYPQAA